MTIYLNRDGSGTLATEYLAVQRDRIGRWTVVLCEELRHTDGRCTNRKLRTVRAATPEEVEQLPVHRDNYQEPDTVCERCGVIGHHHQHHWAPRKLFSDAGWWPTAVLCQKCHADWHAVMGPKPHDQEREAPERLAARQQRTVRRYETLTEAVERVMEAQENGWLHA